jgi:putative ABC transport system permease protein
MSVVIKDVVDYFPTLDPGDREFVIANFNRLSNVRNLVLSRSMHFYPNEVWLTVTANKEQKEAVLDILSTREFGARELYDQAEKIAELKANPLAAAGWGGILLIVVLGVTLVSGLGFVVYAYLSARRRQLEFAILRTLGFSLRQIIGLVCLEQLFVIGISMGIGTFIGLRLGPFMMVFLQLAEKGRRVLPPIVLTTDWFTIGVAYIALTVVFIVTTALVILFFSRVALHRTLRIGDV